MLEAAWIKANRGRTADGRPHRENARRGFGHEVLQTLFGQNANTIVVTDDADQFFVDQSPEIQDRLRRLLRNYDRRKHILTAVTPPMGAEETETHRRVQTMNGEQRMYVNHECTIVNTEVVNGDLVITVADPVDTEHRCFRLPWAQFIKTFSAVNGVRVLEDRLFRQPTPARSKSSE